MVRSDEVAYIEMGPLSIYYVYNVVVIIWT